MSTKETKEFRVNMANVAENWADIISQKVSEHLRQMMPLGAALRETITEHVPDPESAKLLTQATYEISRSVALSGLIVTCTTATLFPVEINGEISDNSNQIVAECEQILMTMEQLKKFVVYLKGIATERADLKFQRPQGSA